MSAHLESAAAAARRPPRLVTLSEAARRLGCHVETLRLRVRRGELAATRGAHGTYLISERAFARIKAPVRSRRRAFSLAELDWTWPELGRAAIAEGASQRFLQVIGVIRRQPRLGKPLARFFDVSRLRLAGLTTAEIAELTRLSTRQVRRLSRRHLLTRLEEGRRSRRDQYNREEPDDADDAARVLEKRLRRQAKRLARRVVARLERRLEAAGVQFHHRIYREGDTFTSSVPLRAFRTKGLDKEMVRHLKAAGLSEVELEAIRLVGVGVDELNHLMLHGLPAGGAQEAAAEP